MPWTGISAAGLALAVILGAFGAHGLRGRLHAYSMSVWERAVFYHFVHMLGALIVSVLARTGALSASVGNWVCALLVGGVVVFSGTLYMLAVTGVRWFGAITPIGGLSFIAAWVLLAVAALRSTA